MLETTLKQAAADRIEAAAPELLELSHRIHGHPELAFTETQASSWCAEMLSVAGFDVEEGVARLPTAFRASAASGSLRIALCTEYDALPDIGHACGHNIIAASSVGAAIGTAAVADAADLTVIVLGTPAEELFGLQDLPADIAGAGKAVLVAAGAFEDVHAAMMCHPAPVDIAAAPTRALTRIRACFSLAEEGVSPILASRRDLLSLDRAVTSCQVAASRLQTEAPAGCSIHLVHTQGCWGLGAHGGRTAAVDFGVWGDHLNDVEALATQLDDCARSAATATGTGVEVQHFLPYPPMRHDPDLVRIYQNNAAARGREFPDLGPIADHLGFATDMGMVSQRIPSIHPLIGIETTAFNHQPEFSTACATSSADRAVIDGAVALASTAIDAAATPTLRGRLLSAHLAAQPPEREP